MTITYAPTSRQGVSGLMTVGDSEIFAAVNAAPKLTIGNVAQLGIAGLAYTKMEGGTAWRIVKALGISMLSGLALRLIVPGIMNTTLIK